MAKRLRQETIYIAPQIFGRVNDYDEAFVFDERNRKQIDLYDLDDKIFVYERQVKEWFLHRAQRMLRGQYNGFVVVMICMSYLEGREIYNRGNDDDSSRRIFKDSIERMYPGRYSNRQKGDFYSSARCSLFHEGMVDGKIIINQEYPDVFRFEGNHTIRINHRLLLQDIKADFNAYLRQLRDESQVELRMNFDHCFNLR